MGSRRTETDPEAKGIVQIQCSSDLDPDSNVIIANADGYPYGSAEYAAMLLSSVFVEVYRRDAQCYG